MNTPSEMKTLKQRLKVSRETFWSELRRMKRERVIKYMHTLDGCPAFYNGDQIGTASRMTPIVLVDSLKTIKREQRATLRWRREQGFDSEPSAYGWNKVVV